MSHAEMSARLALADRTVADAASRALGFFSARGTLGLGTKGPLDFVSAADVAVEEAIREQLARHFPTHGIVGEEGGGPAGDAPPDCWFIDPIDGTTNFLRGLPLWGVSLGLASGGKPALGVVALPALGLRLAAEVGQGFFVNGEPAQRDTLFSAVRLLSVGDADRDFDDSLALIRQLRGAGWMVESYRCTSLGLAFSALGRLDGHVQRHTTAWDITAGLALCAEAGLAVRHGPLDSRPTWVAAGVPALLPLCDTEGMAARCARLRSLV